MDRPRGRWGASSPGLGARNARIGGPEGSPGQEARELRSPEAGSEGSGEGRAGKEAPRHQEGC